jgi:hypothetical protein
VIFEEWSSAKENLAMHFDRTGDHTLYISLHHLKRRWQNKTIKSALTCPPIPSWTSIQGRVKRNQ